MLNLIKAKILAFLPNKYFFKLFKTRLERIEIGASFNPEHWVFYDRTSSPLDKIENVSINSYSQLVENSAKWIVEDLCLREIRLSIRWSAVWQNNDLDFQYYSKLFDYFFSKDINICLNLGPIKTMRWPEEQVPSEVLNDLSNIPPNKSLIGINDEIAIRGYEYLEKILDFISKKYSAENLQKIKIVQLDNEPFNQFGEHQWTFTKEHIAKTIKIASEYFPGRKILLNSNGRNDLNKIFNLIKENPVNFIIGYNYYYKVPIQNAIPIINLMDSLILSNPFNLSADRLKSLSRKLKFDIEISELQAEPWMHIKSPGNSVRDFRFALIRSMDKILNLDQDKKSIVRFWGIEDLAVKVIRDEITDEHRKIIEIIKFINFKN